MACTATATPRVIQDIKNTLSLDTIHKGRLDRQNIYYKVKYKNILLNPLQDLVKTGTFHTRLVTFKTISLTCKFNIFRLQ
jgi:superfamily II DNA helicase RecQ